MLGAVVLASEMTVPAPPHLPRKRGACFPYQRPKCRHVAFKTHAILTMLLVAMICAGKSAAAQPTTPPSGTQFVLVPFEEPGSRDPHAAGITQALISDLAQAGFATAVIAPIEHVAAVADARDLCKANNASALLIPEGRYEQTNKSVYLLYTNTIKYNTHVELRLDEIGCGGTIAWTSTTTSDKSRNGVNVVPGFNTFNNVGAIVDQCFRLAAKEVVAQLAAAPSPPPAGIAPATHAPTAPVPASTTTYLLLPFGQPGIADPRAPEMTGSFARAMAARKIEVKTGPPSDHLAAIAGAQTLCAQNAVGAIIIPSIRVEQVRSSHAELRAALVACDGTILIHALSQADMDENNFCYRPGSRFVDVSERATPALLDQLFPATAKKTAPPVCDRVVPPERP